MLTSGTLVLSLGTPQVAPPLLFIFSTLLSNNQKKALSF